MKRRTFLKSTASAGALTLLTPNALFYSISPAAESTPDVLSGFKNPPGSARPFTWWHWMNGNVTREGITLDLEAMKRAGLGGFQLFDAGTGIVKGPIEYLSPEWLELMKHTISESKRLGLEFAMHNCPGWSSTGGPWVKPETAMQQLTWSEKIIHGGKKKTITLSPPSKNLGYYQDIAVLAFPTTAQPAEHLITAVSLNGSQVDPELLTGIKEGALLLDQHPESSEAMLTVQFKKLTEVGSLSLFSGALQGGAKLRVEWSEDGAHYQPLGAFTGGSDNHSLEGCMPASLSFSPKRMLSLRLTANAPVFICHLSIAPEPKIPDWLHKGNFRNPGWNRNTDNQPLGKPIALDQIHDITSYFDHYSGVLNWPCPSGNWVLLRIGTTATGKLNHSAPTTGTGLECDKFSKSAFKSHFDKMFSTLLAPLASLSQQGKVGLLIDSYEMGMQNWTPLFTQEFLERRHYAITQFLPALTGRLVGDVTTSENFLKDFRSTCADMMAENYYGEFASLCKQHNIISYTEPYGSGPYRELEAGSMVDYPMGEFWAGHTVLWQNSDMIRTVKLASSIAHAKNASIVGAEAFTAEPGSGKWQQYPYSMKALGDWMYTQGLTRIIFHRFAHQPHPTAVPGMTMGPWGIHFDRTNTWYEMGSQWLLYLSRIQYVMQNSDFIADIAYLDSDTPDKSVGTLPWQVPQYPPAGYDYDIISTQTLQKSAVLGDRLTIAGGGNYRVLVLPKIMDAEPEITQHIEKLALAGLNIVCEIPDSESILDYENQWANFIRKLSVLPNVHHELPLKMVLGELALLPDFEFSSRSGDAPVNYIHKATKTHDLYFIANRRRTHENLDCIFRSKGTPEIWDPLTGECYEIPLFTTEGKRTKIPLTLPPCGSVLVCFNKEAESKGYQVYCTESDEPVKKTIAADHTIIRHSNFCVSLWVKPETDIPLTKEQFFGERKTDYYLVYPANQTHRLSSDAATLGITAGRNGVVLFERNGTGISDVLSISIPLSGWTHITVAYEDNIPSLFINGTKVATGIASLYKVHAILGNSNDDENYSCYNGDATQPEISDTSFLRTALSRTVLKGPQQEVPKIPWQFYPGKRSVLFHTDGIFNITQQGHKPSQLVITGTGVFANLSKDWTLSFPTGYGAPDTILMDSLHSLHLHDNRGIRFFSGTCTYSRSFVIPKGLRQRRYKYFIDLGKIEVIAELYINSKKVTTLWCPPYKADVTDYLREAENTIVVKVANLWPNRLIGDEGMPEENQYETTGWEGKFRVLAQGAIKKLPGWYTSGRQKPPGGRVTFSTWKHYEASDPLLESGLIGPVTLSASVFHTFY